MGIFRNEIIPARHVGNAGRVSLGCSGHSETCTFVFSLRFAPLVAGLPDGEWSPIMRVGESTASIVLYPACVACTSNEFRYSTDNTVVYFDSSTGVIVRTISTVLHGEIAVDAMEQAAKESFDDFDYGDDDGDDGDASRGQSSAFNGHLDYVGEFGIIV